MAPSPLEDDGREERKTLSDCFNSQHKRRLIASFTVIHTQIEFINLIRNLSSAKSYLCARFQDKFDYSVVAPLIHWQINISFRIIYSNSILWLMTCGVCCVVWAVGELEASCELRIRQKCSTIKRWTFSDAESSANTS